MASPVCVASAYREAIVARDAKTLGEWIGEETLQCSPDAFLRRDDVLKALSEPRSFLYALLFDSDLLRAGRYEHGALFGRVSESELLASPGVTTAAEAQPRSGRLPRSVRATYSTPAGPREVTFEWRRDRWLISRWGYECFIGEAPKT
jgi:hypothetical protein